MYSLQVYQSNKSFEQLDQDDKSCQPLIKMLGTDKEL